MVLLVIVFLVLLGIVIFFARPKLFFIYWLSIYAFVLPIIYLPLKSSFSPFDKFMPILADYPGAILFLMLLFSIAYWNRTNMRYKVIRILSLPITLLFIFVLFQNIFVGFDIRAFAANIRDILWIILPFVLLLLNKKVRPSRDIFIHFIIIFVYIQAFFCILNILGFRIYGPLLAGFDDNLISGTFARYNHMADYLTIFFYILSYEYWECRGIKMKQFFFLTLLIGLLVLLSGARMSLILFVLIILFFIFCYQSMKTFVISILVLGLFMMLYIVGNDSFLGRKADEGTGFERNLIGITNLVNSDDVSEGSTLEMSARILNYKLNSPIFGNGRSYRKDYYYGKPTEAYNNEGSFKVDARLAFMFVEYGIIGLSLFFFLFFSIFKGCFMYSEEHKKVIYVGAMIYFLLNSITDSGFWDYIIFSSVLIYVFSINNNKKVGECIVSYNDAVKSLGRIES